MEIKIDEKQLESFINQVADKCMARLVQSINQTSIWEEATAQSRVSCAKYVERVLITGGAQNAAHQTVEERIARFDKEVLFDAVRREVSDALKDGGLRKAVFRDIVKYARDAADRMERLDEE